MRLAIPVFYRRIHTYGLDNIPKSGPVILACNHPNSFFDAIIVGYLASRQLNFLTRSDVFNAPWKRWLLGKMNMVPIYRMRDGIENLEKNQETFEKCREVLGRGDIVLIFSEGLCIQEMKLRSLKKGTARIALDFAQSGKPLWIVPVGLNYPHPMQWRKEAFIGFAPAFNAADYKSGFQENPAKAILAFNKKLDELLHGQVIQVKERKDEPPIQSLLEIWYHSKKPSLKEMVSGVNILDEKLVEIREKVITYRVTLQQKEIDDRVVSARTSPSFIRFVIGGLLLLPASLLSYIPFYYTKHISKNKVRLVEFKDSVMIGGGMILTTFFCLFLTLSIAVVNGWAALVAMVLFILLAWVSPWAYDSVVDYLSYTKNKEALPALKHARGEILTWITASLSRGSTP